MSAGDLIRVALAHHRAGRWGQAVAAYRQALAADPESAPLLNNLGAALHAMGQYREAEVLFGRVVELQPGSAEARTNLGLSLQQQGRHEEAAECHRQAIGLDPGSVQAWNNLGLAQQALGRYEEAEASFRRGIAIHGGVVETHVNLGSLLRQLGRSEEAIASCREAVRLRPDHPVAHYNLAAALADAQHTGEAIASYRQAIALNPNYAEAWGNLVALPLPAGEFDAAMEGYRRAVMANPQNPAAHSGYLYALQSHPRIDVATLAGEHRVWAQRYAEPLSSRIRPHANGREPERRLRIGYVSPDLNQHVIGRLMESLLAHHEHGQFHITCYSGTGRADAVTQRLKDCCDAWRETRLLDDERLAEQIRRDGIDILVDLSVHTVGNRLLAFARKPAPVQVTYLGYPGSTGLETIDYRLTDRYLSPPDAPAEGPERLEYLPHGYLPYSASADAPGVSELPALRAGAVTFASFNNFAKVNGEVMALWSRLMNQVPRSRLWLLVAGGRRNPQVYEAFGQQGIEGDRITLVPRLPLAEYLRLYQQVDVALDPFPYNGNTTSYDALYMGAPVVTLAGRRSVSRAGVSILSNLGLTELIAQAPEDYVRIAAELAGDVPRLAELRRTLRDRMRNSPLMDAAQLARDIEAAYRRMWRGWCESDRP